MCTHRDLDILIINFRLVTFLSETNLRVHESCLMEFILRMRGLVHVTGWVRTHLHVGHIEHVPLRDIFIKSHARAHTHTLHTHTCARIIQNNYYCLSVFFKFPVEFNPGGVFTSTLRKYNTEMRLIAEVHCC